MPTKIDRAYYSARHKEWIVEARVYRCRKDWRGHANALTMCRIFRERIEAAARTRCV